MELELIKKIKTKLRSINALLNSMNEKKSFSKGLLIDATKDLYKIHDMLHKEELKEEE